MLQSPYMQPTSQVIKSLAKDPVALTKLYLSLLIILKQKIKENTDLLEKNSALIDSNKELVLKFEETKKMSLDQLVN